MAGMPSGVRLRAYTTGGESPSTASPAVKLKVTALSQDGVEGTDETQDQSVTKVNSIRLNACEEPPAEW